MPVWTLGWLCASPEATRPCSCWHDACLDSGLAFAQVWRPSGLTCWLFGLRAGLCASLEAGSFIILVFVLSDSGLVSVPVWRLAALVMLVFCAAGLRAGLCASLEAGSFVMLVFGLSDSGLVSVPVWRLAALSCLFLRCRDWAREPSQVHTLCPKFLLVLNRRHKHNPLNPVMFTTFALNSEVLVLNPRPYTSHTNPSTLSCSHPMPCHALNCRLLNL